MSGTGPPGEIPSAGPSEDLGPREDHTDRSIRPRVVILCAGASSRLGEPKALALLGDRAVIDGLLQAAYGVDPCPLVIAGRHFAEIGAHLQRTRGAPSDPAPLLVENHRWEAGRTGSVALAAQVAPGSDLLIAPADVPLVGGPVFGALTLAWSRAGAPDRGWLAPWTQPSPAAARRHGHPIVIGAGLAGAILRADDPACPLSQFRSQANPLLGTEVFDEAIHDDLDTPSDLRRLRARIRAARGQP